MLLLSLRAQRGNPGAMDCRAALAMTNLKRKDKFKEALLIMPLKNQPPG